MAAENAEKRKELLDLILLDGAITDVAATRAQLKTLHACIKKVTEDLDGLRFNTAISAMMEFVNAALHWQAKPLPVMKTLLQLLAPFAPHLAEELWARLHATFGQIAPSLTYAPWPKFDPALLVESEIEIPVQVNGKLRDVIKVPADADNAVHTVTAAAYQRSAADRAAPVGVIRAAPVFDCRSDRSASTRGGWPRRGPRRSPAPPRRRDGPSAPSWPFGRARPILR